jgi:hypothetical protein
MARRPSPLPVAVRFHAKRFCVYITVCPYLHNPYLAQRRCAGGRYVAKSRIPTRIQPSIPRAVPPSELANPPK